MKTCPCDKSKLYKDCCHTAHHNIHDVKTAVQLMRSRYSAFVMANGNYLQKSHHSSTKPSKREASEIENWAQSVEWIQLEVIQTNGGLENDTTGMVEFKAFFMENGRLEVIHELSRFCKENDHWVYLDQIG